MEHPTNIAVHSDNENLLDSGRTCKFKPTYSDEQKLL